MVDRIKVIKSVNSTQTVSLSENSARVMNPLAFVRAIYYSQWHPGRALPVPWFFSAGAGGHAELTKARLRRHVVWQVLSFEKAPT